MRPGARDIDAGGSWACDQESFLMRDLQVGFEGTELQVPSSIIFGLSSLPSSPRARAPSARKPNHMEQRDMAKAAAMFPYFT